jgi:hypothetical protein
MRSPSVGCLESTALREQPGGQNGSSRKPSSVPSRSRARGWSSVWDSRHRPPRAAYPRLPPRLRSGPCGVGHTSPPIWPCSDWGLPCHHPLPVVRWALTPPFHPYPSLARGAVCFLWPCPSPLGAQALPGSLPVGARTFLETPEGARDHRTRPAPNDNRVDVLGSMTESRGGVRAAGTPRRSSRAIPCSASSSTSRAASSESPGHSAANGRSFAAALNRSATWA